MTQIFILAATPMLQAGLRAMLSTGEIQVLGEAATPEPLGNFLPEIDAIVIAGNLLLEEVARELPMLNSGRQLSLVVLSDQQEEALARLRTLELFGWSILPLEAPAPQLQSALNACVQGLVVLPALQSQWLYEKLPLVPVPTAMKTQEESLTNREREVLELLGQGLSNKLIARQLQISEHTVKFHVSSISAKLDATSRTDAVRKGLRQGLITL